MMGDSIYRAKRPSLPRVEEKEDDEYSNGREESPNHHLNTTQEVQDLLQYVQTFSFQEQPLAEDDRIQDDGDSSNRCEEVVNQQTLEIPMTDCGSFSATNHEEARVALQLLDEAQKERKEARRWSNDLREAVYAWVSSQRKLLESPIAELREELKQSNLQRLQSEAKLRTLLLDQQDRIAALEATVASQKDQILQLSVSTIPSDPVSTRTTPPSRSNTISTGSTRRGQQQQQTSTTTRNSIMPAVPSTPPPSRRTSSSGKRRQKQPPPTVSPPSPPARQSRRSSSSSTRQRQPLRSLSPPPPSSSSSSSSREVFSNGAVREIFPDREVVRFSNGDTQTTSTINGDVAYYYAATGVTQIESKNKLRLEFANGQVEDHWKKDGRVVIYFADGTEQSFVRSEGEHEEDVSFAVTI